MGTYAVTADLEAVWGVDTIAEWANLENADPAVLAATRITAAITWAEGYLEARMTDGPYKVPLSTSGGDLAVVKDVVARFAGQWLYVNRGRGKAEETDRVMAVAAFAERIVDKLLSGVLRLRTGTKAFTTPTAPVVEGT
jgi:hypothetical protein